MILKIEWKESEEIYLRRRKFYLFIRDELELESILKAKSLTKFKMKRI